MTPLFGNYTGFLFQNAWSLNSVSSRIIALTCLLVLRSEVRVQYQFTTETAFCFHNGSGGSCYTAIYARRPRFPGCRRAGLECLAARSLYGLVFVIIPATTEDPRFPPFLLL